MTQQIKDKQPNKKELPKCLNCPKPVKLSPFGKILKYCSYECMYDYLNKKQKEKKNVSN